MQFCSSDSKFFGHPPRPPIFPATEISAIADFWPKISIFELLRGYRVQKCGQHHNIFSEVLLGIFGAGRNFFGHPAPTISATEISAYSHFLAKIVIFRMFRLKIGH